MYYNDIIDDYLDEMVDKKLSRRSRYANLSPFPMTEDKVEELITSCIPNHYKK